MDDGQLYTLTNSSSWKAINFQGVDDEDFTDIPAVEELTDYEPIRPFTENNFRKHTTDKANRKKRPRDDRRETTSRPVKKLRNFEKLQTKRQPKTFTNKAKAKPKKYDECKTAIRLNLNNLTYDEESVRAWRPMLTPEPVLVALAELKFTTPTQIQTLTIPTAIRDRKDIVGAAETGSGKTLAYGIPIIHHILEELQRDKCYYADESKANKNANSVSNENKGPTKKSKLRCLIVTPTRELAIQVKNHLVAIAKYTPIKIAVIVGGMSSVKQERLLKRQPEIVIGTPGRLWDFIEQGDNHLCDVGQIRYLVIDEADRMLEKGHFDEMSHLLQTINKDEYHKKRRQIFVFSATLSLIHTLPARITLNRKYKKITEKDKLDELMFMIGVRDDKKLVVDITRKIGTVDTLQESRITCQIDEKDIYLYYFATQFPGRTLVFCNSINCVRRLIGLMTILRLSPAGLHSAMQQKQRMKNLEKFSERENSLLIATDVAQRGLDIPDIEHVIHYQVPRTAEAYIHRSGRTARASREGISVMLMEPDEIHMFNRLCKTLNRDPDKDMPLFPVNDATVNSVRRRVKVAQLLAKQEHSDKRFHTQYNWLKKMAVDTDFDMKEAGLEDNVANEYEKAQHNRELKFLKNELEAEFRKPILTRNISMMFPTSTGVDLNSMLLHPQDQKTAVEVIKHHKENPKRKYIGNIRIKSWKSKTKKKRNRRKKRAF